MDEERAKEYEMPEGSMEEVIKGYQNTALEKIREYTRAQFEHWTREEFSSCFRKMLTLEQYRDSQMARLYQNYLVDGPVRYMESIFAGMTGNKDEARQLALDFYGPIFLLYSLYDSTEKKDHVTDMLDEHIRRFSKILLQEPVNRA